MAIITISYPESWLSWTVSVVNLSTAVQDFSWSLTEVWTTKLYKYEFTEVSWQSYAYTITVAWYNDYVDSIIYETSSSWWWLTPEQDAELTQIYNRVDENISAIAVWWNPYVWDMKKWMNAVIKKIEEKWNEIIKEIEYIEEDIIEAIPEQKEPIVNVTTEKVDMSSMMNCIKAVEFSISEEIKWIKLPENEKVDLTPIIKEVKNIWKISDIKFPEQKEVLFDEIIDSIKESNKEIHDKIEESKEFIIEAVWIDKKISRWLAEFIVNRIPDEDEMHSKKWLPDEFTATLK